MQDRFVEKLRRIQQAQKTDIGLVLSPSLLTMPLPMIRLDDPFLPFSKALIEATRDLVCAYIFDLAAYLALAAAGAVALERSISYVGEGCVTVMHGAFATGAYAYAMGDNAFNVDAVTVTNEPAARAYWTQPNLGAFILSELPTMLETEQGINIYVFVPNLHDNRGEDFTYSICSAIKEANHAR